MKLSTSGMMVIVGNILIFIGIFTAYLWFVPLGIILDIIGALLYTVEKRRQKREKLSE